MTTAVIECRGALFDLDGTLLDSAAGIRDSWRAVAVEFGADPDAVVAASLATRAREVVARFFPADLHEAAFAASRRESIARARSVRPLPGALDLLAALPVGSWGYVTSGRGEIMRVRLAAAGLPVPEVFVTAEDVVGGKPDPAPYLVGLSLLGAAPEEVVAFEDTPEGITAARAAGLRVVGVVGTHPVGVLTAAGADLTVGCPAEVSVTVLAPVGGAAPTVRLTTV